MILEVWKNHYLITLKERDAKMAEFSFYLSREDTDRVFALKAEAGEDNMTANEYAQYLLERELHRLYPQTVQYDEDGIVPRRKTHT